jgi:hypothetical protein
MQRDNPPIDEIFWQAAQLTSAAEQSAYLDRACAGSPALRRNVEKLLRARPRAQRYLEQPPAAPVAVTVDVSDGGASGSAGGFEWSDAPDPAEAVGTQIGPYKLREQIGEGGMGVVYVAEQTEPV